VAAAGDRLYLSRRRQGVTTLTAWSLDSLTRRWQTTGAPVGAVYSCGPVLCVNSETFSAVDPADGRVLWQRTGLNILPGYDGRTLIGYDWSDDPQAVALDPLTGRVLGRLGTSTQIGPVLLRVDSVVPGRTWVEVPGADGALHLVGGLDTGAAYGCEALGLDLACPTTAGPTQVWRLPSGE
jgi:outer membrane protein assembly factor BamB